MNEVCPNLIDIPGCLCHQANLVAKDEQKSTNSPFGSIVAFLTALSGLISNSKKMKSILKQVCSTFDVENVPDFSTTRFLAMHDMLENVLDHYPVIEKLIRISRDSKLISFINNDKFIVHLDQFLIHIRPLYLLTKSLQSPDMNIHELLISLLQCISQLLYRIGNNIQLTPKKYCSLLYQKKTAGTQKEPKDYSSNQSVMLYSR